MRTMLLSVSVLLLSIFAVPQETKHAPSLESCKADLNLWASAIEGPDDQVAEKLKSIPFDEFWARDQYLSDCLTAYPKDFLNSAKSMIAHQRLMGAYMAATENRLSRFIRRHNLWEQFKQEDEAGKR